MSIITATYRRRTLLEQRCLPSVDAQTYPNIEHVIVGDGPEDDGFRAFVGGGPKVDRRYVTLGRNWRAFREGQSWGADPRLAGTLLARGRYIGYLDDDDAYRPEHVATLVAVLERTGADFVYSMMRRPDGLIVGQGRPQVNHIGTPMVLHRAELLRVANWEPHGYTEDWHLIERWLAAGATFVRVPQVTVDIWPHGQAA